MRILDVLREGLLPPGAFPGVYSEAVFFEVAKFASHLRQSIQFFVESEDPRLAALDPMT